MFQKLQATLLSLLIVTVGDLTLAQERPRDARSQLVLHTDFSGGSAEAVEVDQQARRIRLRPTPHPGRGWDCWWFCRIEGAMSGETLTLEVGKVPWATPRCAAVSTDGKNWGQTEPGTLQGEWITYRLSVGSDQLWLAWGPPFTLADAAELVAWAEAQRLGGKALELCQTSEGRSVPALRVEPSSPAAPVRHGVWVQARQHAWESGSSWVCRGFVEWLMSADPYAQRLRDVATITIVPVMDVDNVVVGAGGKNQEPHDHNRDWSDEPHWPAVRAAMRELLQMDAAEQLDVFVDLHNPDAGAARPFFFLPPAEILTDRRQRNLDRFLASTRVEMTGPLPFVGEVRESGAGYDPAWRQISKNWVTLHSRDHVIAVTLETAWNTPSSNTEGYRAVGRQLGLAIERYLRVDPRGD